MLDILLLLGLALLIGFWGGNSVTKLRAPQVVGFIFIGVLLGESGIGLIGQEILGKLEVIGFVALALIGFDVGGELTIDVLRKLGRSIITITVLEALGAFFLVTLAVYAYMGELSVALIFGALACATAPAATVDVLREYRSSGPLTSTLFGVVALDDAAAIAIYAFASTFAKMALGGGGTPTVEVMVGPTLEIFEALALGLIMGVLLSRVIANVYAANELLILGFGSILICSGIANSLQLSLILANMALGLTLVNLSPFGEKKAFKAVMGISAPIYILFFVTVGARLNIALLSKLGVLGIAYIIFRTIGKWLGTMLGARISKAEDSVKRYLGLCLFSQAGVAIGLSIQAMHDFQAYGEAGAALGLMTINVIAATTFIFQMIGPYFTRYAVIKAGEVNFDDMEVNE